jgi:hypothetical protein
VTTRRDFLVAASVIAGGGALADGALASVGGASANLGSSRPVVAFFDGQLGLDTSGASVAYRPPTAARAMPSLSDEELARVRGYI